VRALTAGGSAPAGSLRRRRTPPRSDTCRAV